MTSTEAARPIYLDLAPDPVFGLFHAAASGSERPTGVLLCAPWGWDEVTSYRSRRAWAAQLAAAGHPTLRIDLPGSGDSGGSPGDPGRLEAWSRAVAAGATWLRSTAGCERVAIIGLGLGGLVAGKALDGGAPIDDLLLWAVPSSGRAFMREARAFAALQTSRYTLTGEPEPTLLPDGWMEVGGFVLVADTIKSLEALSLTDLSTRGLQRALLLERDGLAVDARLREHLEGAGVGVTVAPGPGWGAMTFHPERYAPPLQVFERVAAWLADGLEPGRAPSADAPATRDEIELHVGTARIRETPLILDSGGGQLFGVLAQPGGQPAAAMSAVFLNAGAVRRVGPNRLWVEAARRWAAAGVPTLRIDLEGIGDSDGDAGRFIQVGEFYSAQMGVHVTAALDALERRGLGRRFALIGLCSGAYWAFHTAADDERVAAAFLLNSRALIWDTALETRREARRIEGLLRPTSWGRLLRGEIEPALLAKFARAIVVHGARSAIGLGRRIWPTRAPDPLGSTLDRMRETGTRVVLAFSGDEPLHRELAADGLFARIHRWPNVSLRDLPGRDHTVRSMVAQAAVHELLDRELAIELDRAGEALQPGRGG